MFKTAPKTSKPDFSGYNLLKINACFGEFQRKKLIRGNSCLIFK